MDEFTNSDEQKTQSLQSIESHLEKMMLELPQDIPPQEHKQYLAGYVDCLCDCEKISEEDREKLYVTYAS